METRDGQGAVSEVQAAHMVGSASVVALDVACLSLALVIPPFPWSSLAVLPETVAFRVLTCLPVSDVVQLGRVSREWHAIVGLAGLWTVLLERDFGVHPHAWTRTLAFSGYGAGQVARPWLTQTMAVDTGAGSIPSPTTQAQQSADTRSASWALATARHQYRANLVFLRQRSRARQDAVRKYQGMLGGTWHVGQVEQPP
jgi:hypothetical protein